MIDKFARAKTAVANGVDLVVEMPVVYSLSSANFFARAGVNFILQSRKKLNRFVRCLEVNVCHNSKSISFTILMYEYVNTTRFTTVISIR